MKIAAAALRPSAVLGAGAILVAVFVTAAAGASRPIAGFAPSGLIPAGTNPCSLAVASLDGDDELDLAVSDCASDTVAILLGDGSGHFRRAAGSPIAVGDQPSTVLGSDFNGDGRADLAVANDRSNDITILLGHGAGNFTAAPGSPLQLGGSPQQLASGDFNNDNRADLAVVVFSRRVAILLGDGSGRFRAAAGSPLTVGAGYGPHEVVVADFNQDRTADLAVATDDPMQIAILLGSGTGSFRSLPIIRAGLKAVGDFNGDGKPDLATATQASARAPYKATVLLGTGSGLFSPVAGLTVKGQFWSTAGVAADFNGDRKLDLAIRDDRGTPSLLLGDGRGRFRPAADSPLPLPASSAGVYMFAPADVNRDGQSDLVVAIRRVPERGGESGLAVLWRSPSRPSSVPGGPFPSRRDAVFSTKASIWELDADGNRAGVVTAKGKPCGRVRIVVWTAPRRKSESFDHACIGDAVTHIALGGGQVAWLQQGGGNSLELIITAARLSGGKPKQIVFTTNGNRAGGDPRGGWLGQLLGGGPLLAYNSWTIRCEVPEGYGCDDPAPLIVAEPRLIRIVARRQVIVKRGRESFALAAVGGGRMAVESAGAISVLAPNGSRVATVAAVDDNPPRAIALSRTRLAVLRTFTLDLYVPATGRHTKSIPLGPAAMLQLAGVNSTLALFRSPQRLVLVRLKDGKLVSLALRLKSHVDAKLTDAGLFVAYNVQRGRARGRIVFEPAARLLARF